MSEVERENNFREWLRARVDTQAPISSYPTALRRLIPDKLNELNEAVYTNLFSCIDLEYLNNLKIRLLNNGDLHQFNIDTQSRVSSAAIQKYIEFLESKNTTYWLIPSNQSQYDAIGAFKKFKIIDWGNGQNNSIKSGDIVYLYASKPIGSIVAKAKVIKADFSSEELLDDDYSEFEKRTDPKTPDSYFRLELLKFTNQQLLSSQKLQQHGLNGNVQGKRTINKKLLEYILNNEDGAIEEMKNTLTTQPLNQILYGPPGTGKTYNTINKALEIIDGIVPDSRIKIKERFEELKKAEQIEFVTFHQSYGYEEFVEGIKAKTSEKGIEYKIESGIFKKLSKQAKENYENSQKSSEKLKQEKSLQQKIEQFLNDSLEESREFSKTKGGKFKIKDIINSSIFVFTEDSNYNENILELDIDELFKILDSDIELKTSRQLAKDIFEINNQRQKDTYYFSMYKEFQKQDFNVAEDEKIEEPLKNFVLIIDEINRGNISKIFGELITLIEPSKRIGADEEIRVKLPYSNDDFGVPSNLHIIGTMNTADRSIALMDTALRRRFDFEEMMPNLETLKELTDISGVNTQKLLETINKRIEYLYDRDHTIGHAYFMSLKEKASLDELENIFRNKIIPLLQEYFYDDWEKIRLVLGDNQKEEEHQFIKIKKDYDIGKLFGSNVSDIDMDDEQKVYEINKDAFKKPESYKKIYETK